MLFEVFGPQVAGHPKSRLEPLQKGLQVGPGARGRLCRCGPSEGHCGLFQGRSPASPPVLLCSIDRRRVHSSQVCSRSDDSDELCTSWAGPASQQGQQVAGAASGPAGPEPAVLLAGDLEPGRVVAAVQGAAAPPGVAMPGPPRAGPLEFGRPGPGQGGQHFQPPEVPDRHRRGSSSRKMP